MARYPTPPASTSYVPPATPMYPMMSGTYWDDTLVGHNDRVNGDRISGGYGNDSIHAGLGADILDGGAGNDRLWGDAGNDTETGGTGRDQFIFAWDKGKDVITDFSIAQADTVQLYDQWMPDTYIRSIIDASVSAADPNYGTVVNNWTSHDGSGGIVMQTNWEWAAPQNLDNSGPADAVMHIWSNDWVNFAKDIQWRAANFTDANGDYKYNKDDMHDSVTFLNWGGDTNGDHQLDYLSIAPVEHPTTDPGQTYAFADHYL